MGTARCVKEKTLTHMKYDKTQGLYRENTDCLFLQNSESGHAEQILFVNLGFAARNAVWYFTERGEL